MIAVLGVVLFVLVFWRIATLVGQVSQERMRASELERSVVFERTEAESQRKLQEMRAAFLTAVSHEIRTPLTSVLGFADLLHRHDDRLTDDQRRAYVQRLKTGTERLDRLMGDLLDVDRVVRGEMSPRRASVDLGSLVRQVIDKAGIRDRRAVHLDTPPVEGSVEPAKVERIVENLVSNADRHTPADSPIWVRVEDTAEGALVVVEDAGPGVPGELRRAIFEPFVQGDEIVDHSPGMGIGLSLVARLTELHGGRAWVEDRKGGGASFRVLFPHVAPGELVEGSEKRRSTEEAATMGERDDTSGIEEIVRPIVTVLQRITGLESVYLTRILWDENIQEIRAACNAGELEVREGARIPWSKTACRQALLQRVNYTLDAAADLPEATSARELGIATYIGYPVRTPSGELYGTLCGASSRRHPVDEMLRDLFALLARVIGYGAERRPDMRGEGRMLTSPPPGPR